MTQVHDFEYGAYQVVCIAAPNGSRWSSAAMLMQLDSREFDDRPRWFGHDLPSPSAALFFAQRRAKELIDADAIDLEPPTWSLPADTGKSIKFART